MLQTNRLRRQTFNVAEIKDEQKAQSDQLLAFQAKSHQDVTLLEDFRDFCKKRSQLEANYANQLKSLSQSHSNKHKWDDLLKDHGQNATVVSSFKLVLDEADILSVKHTEISSCLSHEIAEVLKSQIKVKVLRMKKNTELHSKMQESFHTSQHDFEKSKKTYEDLEKVAQIAEASYGELEKKHATRKSSSMKIFAGSKAESEKRVKKAYSKMIHCKSKAQRARNDQILAVDAMNGQLAYYYENDIPNFLKIMDDDFYECLTGYFQSYSEVQREAAESLIESCNTMDDFFKCISKDYEENHFLDKPLFKNNHPLKFIPIGTDKITSIVVDEQSQEQLNREAKRLVGSCSKSRKTISQKEKELSSIEGMMNFNKDNMETDPTLDAETELVDIRFQIIEGYWTLARSTAKIENLKTVGVHIPEEEDVERLPSIGPSHTSNDSREGITGKYVTVMYTYETDEPDELQINEDETIQLVQLSEDGWVMARNENGEEGLIPISYVDLSSALSRQTSMTSRSRTSSSLSQSSVPIPTVVKSSPIPERMPAQSAPLTSGAQITVALYEYEANGPDELSFDTGDEIEVISFSTADIDDGWWKGRLNGKEGAFPSILTELQE